MVKSLELIDTGDNFQNRIIEAQALKSTKDTVIREKMTAYRMGKDLYQPYIQWRANIQNF